MHIFSFSDSTDSINFGNEFIFFEAAHATPLHVLHQLIRIPKPTKQSFSQAFPSLRTDRNPNSCCLAVVSEVKTSITFFTLGHINSHGKMSNNLIK